jgi:hypothetical protein
MFTISSTKVEYVGSSEAAQEGFWVQCLLNDFLDSHSYNRIVETAETYINVGVETHETRDSATAKFPAGRELKFPQLLYMNNERTIKIAMSSASHVHNRTKHIDI